MHVGSDTVQLAPKPSQHIRFQLSGEYKSFICSLEYASHSYYPIYLDKSDRLVFKFTETAQTIKIGYIAARGESKRIKLYFKEARFNIRNILVLWAHNRFNLDINGHITFSITFNQSGKYYVLKSLGYISLLVKMHIDKLIPDRLVS